MAAFVVNRGQSASHREHKIGSRTASAKGIGRICVILPGLGERRFAGRMRALLPPVRRGGARSTVSLSARKGHHGAREGAAKARGAPGSAGQSRRSRASYSASSLPSSAGPSFPSNAIGPAEQPQADLGRQVSECRDIDVTGPSSGKATGHKASQRLVHRRRTARPRRRAIRCARLREALRCQAFAREQRHQRAQARPGKTRVGVRRIDREGDIGRREGGDQARLGDAQQRPRAASCRCRFAVPEAGATWVIPRKSRNAASAREPEQDRLGLVVERMGGQRRAARRAWRAALRAGGSAPSRAAS